MQTFMPFESYAASAACLDDKRLGKQRVEAFQIVKALRGDYNDSGAWVNHPATKMWQGHIAELCRYGMVMCWEWTNRGFDDSLVTQFVNLCQEYANKEQTVRPWWIDDQLLLMTHRSNLVRKAPEFYSFNVPNNMPYVWPLMDEHAYRLGTYKFGDNMSMFHNDIVYITQQQIAQLFDVPNKIISKHKASGSLPPADREYGRTSLWRYKTITDWYNNLPELLGVSDE